MSTSHGAAAACADPTEARRSRGSAAVAALADDLRVRPEGGDGEPEGLVEGDRLTVLGDAAGADVAAVRYEARRHRTTRRRPPTVTRTMPLRRSAENGTATASLPRSMNTTRAFGGSRVSFACDAAKNGGLETSS